MNSIIKSSSFQVGSFHKILGVLRHGFFACALVSVPICGFAQNRVVVVPLGGDDISSLPAFPQVWAQVDSNAGGTSENDVGQIEVNSISINAPSDGFLVISGKALINSNDTSVTSYALRAKIDGSYVSVPSFDGLVALDGGGEIRVGTSVYTVTTPITAGTHTISQDLGPFFGTSSFFHNAETLTVMFFATGEVSSRASKQPATNDLDSQGN